MPYLCNKLSWTARNTCQEEPRVSPWGGARPCPHGIRVHAPSLHYFLERPDIYWHIPLWRTYYCDMSTIRLTLWYSAILTPTHHRAITTLWRRSVGPQEIMGCRSQHQMASLCGPPYKSHSMRALDPLSSFSHYRTEGWVHIYLLSQ